MTCACVPLCYISMICLGCSFLLCTFNTGKNVTQTRALEITRKKQDKSNIRNARCMSGDKSKMVVN